jgi:hypothetical protein
MFTRCLAASIVIALVIPVGAIAQQHATTPIDYDSFCKLANVESKRAALRVTSPDNRAMLIGTHITRWREANKARLTGEQMSIIAEVMSFVTPSTYDRTRRQPPEVQSQMHAAVKRLHELFGWKDVKAVEPYGPCVPTGK